MLFSARSEETCRFFQLFKRYDGYKTGELKLKRPRQLQEVLDLSRHLLQENQDLLKKRRACFQELSGTGGGGDAVQTTNEDLSRVRLELEQTEEAIRKWDQLRGVLQMYASL